MATAEGVMLTNAGRGMMSVIIAGVNVCAIVSTLPGFVKISDGNTIGPHIYGTLDGVVIVRIPSAATLNADIMLGLYKGLSPFESGLVLTTDGYAADEYIALAA